MIQWRKFRALPGREQYFLLAAFILQPLLTLALRMWGFKSVYAFLYRTSPTSQPPPPPHPSVEPTITELRDLARRVNTAATRGPIRTACLVRSLTLWWLLRRQGIASELRIGVRKDGGELAAHAWVEYAGAVINDSPESIQRFAAFDAAIAPPEIEKTGAAFAAFSISTGVHCNAPIWPPCWPPWIAAGQTDRACGSTARWGWATPCCGPRPNRYTSSRR